MLAFARDHQLQGRVGGRVQSQLGVCETQCYRLLAGLLDRPEARRPNPSSWRSCGRCGTVAVDCPTPSAGDPPAH